MKASDLCKEMQFIYSTAQANWAVYITVKIINIFFVVLFLTICKTYNSQYFSFFFFFFFLNHFYGEGQMKSVIHYFLLLFILSNLKQLFFFFAAFPPFIKTVLFSQPTTLGKNYGINTSRGCSFRVFFYLAVNKLITDKMQNIFL